ncbi:hypothetical protein [Sphingomonas glaciei]|uniref:Uncharacterized protein n=1 Tax=Sphingomonas glaciei TaxID=2938948 RepID=A0ABY5MUG8_9SPHN|nr:hypothetical protein [Sphingomonas glaciei]UUR08139.1 hypothetical protein M1K48_00360 [Sphingomonas glaciei]
MLNKRHEIAQAIANELLPSEKEVDSAIVRSAKLMIAVVEGRRAARVCLSIGQEGLDLVAQASVKLVVARGLLAEAHVAFRKTQSEVGLDAFNYGDAAECPPPTGLAVVPSVRAA